MVVYIYIYILKPYDYLKTIYNNKNLNNSGKTQLMIVHVVEPWSGSCLQDGLQNTMVLFFLSFSMNSAP